ncbi:MAG TPA: glycine zipper 2TM domain-containing protein [Burkholderiales bacterium]|jgi:outer membrane lipoprotein SlyB|nr:glycine zipper 2TM domain-containing protein [Burkholderiales bacterium]
MEGKAHPLIIAAAASVLLFSVAGTAALMGWLPNSHGDQTEQIAEKEAAQKEAAEKEAAAKQAAEERRNSTSKPRYAERVSAVGQLGVIESVRATTVRGEGTGLGAVAGGVAGGVVGHQIGGGRGKDVMTVVGVVGGGLAGHEAEKYMRGTKQYEVTVRFDDGTSKTYLRTNPPTFKSGERVRVVNGDIRYV